MAVRTVLRSESAAAISGVAPATSRAKGHYTLAICGRLTRLSHASCDYAPSPSLQTVLHIKKGLLHLTFLKYNRCSCGGNKLLSGDLRDSTQCCGTAHY